jgi:hypothetical protein
VKLFGILPVDYDDLRLVERGPGFRFQEDSKTLSFAVWRHERTVMPAGDSSCTVTDRLQFELKPALAWVPGSAGFATRIVRAIFRHRHRRLSAR